MNIKEAEKLITQVMDKSNFSVFIWGPPGVGKSALVRQIAEKAKLRLIDVRLALLDPVDLRGLPVPNKETGVVKWLTPDFLPRDGAGVLFLDELNLAPQAVQNASYQLILDRKLGDYTIPEGWKVIAAGNRREDKAAVIPMSLPLANRFIHVDVDVDVETWTEWAFRNHIDEKVISFIQFKPSLLLNNPGDSNTFPTPRGWERVSCFTKDVNEFDPSLSRLMGAIVGPGAAGELKAYISVYEQLPNIKEMIKSGDTSAIPELHDVLYAFCTALVTYGEKAVDKKLTNIVKLIKAIPEKDFSVMTMKQLVTLNKNVAVNPEFSNWVRNYKHIIFKDLL